MDEIDFHVRVTVRACLQRDWPRAETFFGGILENFIVWRARKNGIWVYFLRIFALKMDSECSNSIYSQSYCTRELIKSIMRADSISLSCRVHDDVTDLLGQSRFRNGRFHCGHRKQSKIDLHRECMKLCEEQFFAIRICKKLEVYA